MDAAERLDTVQRVEDILAHHGVKGMKWGIRKDRGKSKGGSSSDDKVKPKKAEASGSEGAPKRSADGRIQKGAHEARTNHTTSDAELRAAINRIKMDREYAELTKPPPSKGDKAKAFVLDILTDVGKKQAKNLLNTLAADQIQKAFGPAATPTKDKSKPEPVNIGQVKVTTHRPSNPAAGKKPIRIIEAKSTVKK